MLVVPVTKNKTKKTLGPEVASWETDKYGIKSVNLKKRKKKEIKNKMPIIYKRLL